MHVVGTNTITRCGREGKNKRAAELGWAHGGQGVGPDESDNSSEGGNLVPNLLHVVPNRILNPA